jgi:high affinity Mn2+ porin
VILVLVLMCRLASAEEAPAEERWGAHLQATTVVQANSYFAAPYDGPFSFSGQQETRTSFTSTLFAGARIWKGGEIYANPEAAGGRGLSGVNGIAGFPNGEVPRIGDPQITVHLARAFLRQIWALDSEREAVSSDQNQLAGTVPRDRLTLTAGKFAASDLFDQNAYAHDPRGQFLNWSLMANTAWDYPADTWGYTWGFALEGRRGSWSARAGAFQMPTVANGPDLDWGIGYAHGVVGELERRVEVRGRPGTVRLLTFVNTARMGTYRSALDQTSPPSVIATRVAGTYKYGFGLNVEQELTEGVGAFARLGWNDGHTESFAFTPVDRTASAGLSFQGARWDRPGDTAGLAFGTNGLSGVHADYLAAGGNDFMLGDGRLNYAPEWILEMYYRWKLPYGFEVTADGQGILNPGYNRDRGPVGVGAIRLHYQI